MYGTVKSKVIKPVPEPNSDIKGKNGGGGRRG
jgi:hypothetical protein